MNRLGWGLMIAAIAALTLAFCTGDDARKGPRYAAPAAGDAASLDGMRLVIPVEGVRPDQLVDSWHDPRGDGTRAHEALDIPAPGGTPVLAAFSGTVVKLFTSKAGGLTVYVRSGDIQAYYAHLAGYADGLREGQRVVAGETIAFVGDTGNAGAGNTHLHFAAHRMLPGDGWWQGTPVNPFPLFVRPAN